MRGCTTGAGCRSLVTCGMLTSPQATLISSTIHRSSSRGFRLRRRKTMAPDISIILVATDFNSTSTPAVDYAAALANRLEARLRVLHVVQEPYPSGPGWELYVRDAGAIRERLDEDARAAMTRVLTPLLASGLPVISELRHGS